MCAAGAGQLKCAQREGAQPARLPGRPVGPGAPLCLRCQRSVPPESLGNFVRRNTPGGDATNYTGSRLQQEVTEGSEPAARPPATPVPERAGEALAQPPAGDSPAVRHSLTPLLPVPRPLRQGSTRASPVSPGEASFALKDRGGGRRSGAGRYGRGHKARPAPRLGAV